MMFLSPSSTFHANTPPPLSSVKKPFSAARPLFEFDTIPFLYDKKAKQWCELDEGKTMFAFDKDTSSITIRCGDRLNHKIAANTQLQKQIATSKCWVFRAVHCLTENHDVVCLQLCENSAAFVVQYERHRAKCLAELESLTPGGRSSARASPFTSATGKQMMGRDLSPVGTIELAQTVRRRLSNSLLEGSSPGGEARFEDQALQQPSPAKLSPMRSSNGKTLRGKPSNVLFSAISVKGSSATNPDKPNQDSMLLHQLPNGELVFGVFDGHGSEGHEVSRYFKQRLPKLLAKTTLDDEAITEALTRTERELIDNCRIDTTLSGSTGVTVIVRGDEVTVANVGDSRAVLGMVHHNTTDTSVLLAKDLSQDHKPDSPEEQKRILEVGGRVFAIKFDDGIDGPARVWLSYADYPGLAMSRSLCDTIAKEAGVISKPDFVHETLTKEHKLMVIASDGLWEFLSSQEVVDICAKYMYATGPDPEAAVQELVRESNKRWKLNEPVVDDTTIIVCFFV